MVGNIFVISLLRDLTYDGDIDFGIYITSHFKSDSVKQYPSSNSFLVDYCKELLEKEGLNIHKSILDISHSKEETFIMSITTNREEILLNLNSEKDEKTLVKIYNIYGVLKFESSYYIFKGDQTLVINTSNFKKGIYVLQITMGGKIKSQTIII